MNRLIRQIKNHFIPAGRKLRCIPLGPAKDCILDLDLQHELGKYIGLYERELWRHVKPYLHPGIIVFDVGAGNGYYSVIAAARGACVVAFEPDASAAASLRRAVELTGLPVRVVEDIVMGSEHGGGRTLDDYVKTYGNPGFVKIDVEGAEGSLLRGFSRTLAESGPPLVIETHDVQIEDDCVELLGQKGYKTLIVQRRWWFPEHRPIEHNRWLVCRKD